MSELEPGYQGKEIICEYARMTQRWMVVFSQAAQERELKTLEKAQAKELEKAQKELFGEPPALSNPSASNYASVDCSTSLRGSGLIAIRYRLTSAKTHQRPAKSHQSLV